MRIRTGISIVLAVALASCAGGGGISRTTLPQGTNSGLIPQADTQWQVQSGGARLDDALVALAFGPETITIDEGDSVTWTDAGDAHTVTFFGPFKAPQAPPPVPAGGPNPSYDGSTYISSGILQPEQTYTVTFTKAGTYPYVCLFHSPEHRGVVLVQPRGTPYPHPQGFYNGTGTAELEHLLNDAMASVSTIPYAVGGTHVAAGVSPPLSNGIPPKSSVLRFLDGNRLNLTTVTISVGTTVTWTSLDLSNPHTVTFPIAGQPLPPLPGEPFTPPIGGSTYDGTQITNSGVINEGNSYSLTFTRRGTFTYFCLFHEEQHMIGTVIVK
jgi:plastocyanin